MPEQSSRGERGLRKDPGGHDPDRSSLPRQVTSGGALGRPPRESLPQSADELSALGGAFWSIVDEGLGQLDEAISPGARAALDAQARLLLAWNRAINLTALRDEAQIARGHVLDSLSALALLRRLGCDHLLDLGSGAGYPGLPLAVSLPVRRCALVDSVRKKQSFLATVAAAAAAAMAAAGEEPPQLVALGERAEDLADEPDHREGWDVVVARAVGSLAEVVELGLPLARIGGHVVAWKRDAPDGAALSHEVRRATRVLQAAGGARPRLEQVPGLAEAGLPGHTLVVVRKLRPTPDRYPRTPTERRRALLP